MIKAVIFDLDGTTLNTIDDIHNSLDIVLKKYNIEPTTFEKVRTALGTGSRNLVKKHLSTQVDEETVNKIADEYVETYGKYCNVYTRPYEGIYELLIELQSKGIALAVNSNKPDKLCKELMSAHFPKIKFKEIIGARKGVPIKPDPFSTNEIIQVLSVDKKEILYVGDSESDIATAKNAGLKSVGCLWGFRDLKTLTEAKADIIISSPKELLNYLN